MRRKGAENCRIRVNAALRGRDLFAFAFSL
ncbi:hypothetical protein ABH904_001208 [Pseudomonas frederiksbergensis]